MKPFTDIPVFACVVYVHVLSVCYGQYDTKGLSEKSAKTCTKPPFVGVCHPLTEAYYYDAQTNNCKMLPPGVCAGGNNLFPSMKRCAKQCVPLTPSSSKVCLQPPVVGPCGPLQVSWYFDPQTMFCKMFNHTICGGVGNAFRSELKCQEMCLPTQKPEAFCSKPPKPGRCFLAKKRYYFDDIRNGCFMFAENKCGSNRNGFSKWEKCMQRCSYTKSTMPCPTCAQKINNELPHGGVAGYPTQPGQVGPYGPAGYPPAPGGQPAPTGSIGVPNQNVLPGQVNHPTLPGQTGLPGQPVIGGHPSNVIPTGPLATPGHPNQHGLPVLPGQNPTPGQATGPFLAGQTAKPNITPGYPTRAG
ncbi:tissue factor pathway inhibitor 2-like [Dermacentor variabilis]|uniref:tissue factor pathway inhibitor 2-like n=1 Tax=Dermacentor variabilis TaxID=34621 RepID=UPI003F5B96F9